MISDDLVFKALADSSRRFLLDSFAASNGNVPELLVGLTQSDGFLFRPVTVPQP